MAPVLFILNLTVGSLSVVEDLVANTKSPLVRLEVLVSLNPMYAGAYVEVFPAV